MPVFNFTGLIADALILGNIIYQKDMSYISEPEISRKALEKGLQVFTRSQELRNVRSVSCSQEATTNIELPNIGEGQPGYTTLIPKVAYMETMDINESGDVVSTNTAPITNAETELPIKEKTNPSLSDTSTEIEHYERDWFDNEDGFKSNFIDKLEKTELQYIINGIDDKISSLNIIAETSNATLENDVNTHEKSVNDLKKTVNQLEKEIAKYESNIDKLKRNTGEEPSSEILELQKKLNVLYRVRLNQNKVLKQNEKILEDAKYHLKYKDKAKDTVKKLENLLIYIRNKINENDTNLKTAQGEQIVKIMRDLKDQTNDLLNFLFENQDEIEHANYTESQLKEILSILNEIKEKNEHLKYITSYLGEDIRNWDNLYNTLTSKYKELLSNRIRNPPSK